MPTMTIDALRTRGEAFLEALEEEGYLNGAGLKDEPNVAAIYARYEDLATRDAVACAREAAGRVDLDETEQRRRRALREFVTMNALERASAEVADAVLGYEATAKVVAAGQEMGFRESAVRIANEAHRPTRRAIAQARSEAVAALTPLLQRLRDLWQAESVGLGYPDYLSLCRAVGGVDLDGLESQCAHFLRATEDAYRDLLAWFLKRQVGVALPDAERHDLTHLMRAPAYDAHFPAASLLSTVEKMLGAMGLDLTAGGRIILDTEERPAKSPRAFCAPIRVPDRVILVMRPHGGKEDYETFLHELGHSLHFAHVDPEAPFEFRRLGDHAITEGFAFTFDHLAMDRAWLARFLGMRNGDFLRFAWFVNLAFLRRYAAKVGYEQVLHAGLPLREAEQQYVERLTRATLVAYSPHECLYDVDPHFYCARYLRAWMLEARLHAVLTEQCDEDWFWNPRAGPLLVGWWREGQAWMAEEWAPRVGAAPPTMEALRQAVMAHLG